MSLSATGSATTHLDIQPLLRPSDRVSVSIPCRVRTDGMQFHKAEAAIVCHDAHDIVFAALMVVTPPTNVSETRITHLIPITNHFKHSLNQTPPSPSTSFFHQSSRPHITLTLSDGSALVDLRIASNLIVRVQALTAELRRWVEIAASTALETSNISSWVEFYPVDPPTYHDVKDEEVITPSESSMSSLISPSSSSMTIQTISTPLTALTIPSVEGEEDHWPNPFHPDFSRSAFLRKRLYARQSKWSSHTPIKIRLATYNVNDILPPAGTTELVPLVGQGEEDLLVFGFQEVDLRRQALLYSQGNIRANEWEAAIRRGLGEKASEYEKLAMTQYVGVVTIAFVKKNKKDVISRVETVERGIGLLGIGGNKAGVCIRLKIHDSTISIVNSHLAAFATALERRRSDFQTLLKGLTFPRPMGEDALPAYEEFLPEIRDRLVGVEDSHVLFWLGDLNYRIDMEDDILRAWVEEKRWKQILEKDQLIGDISGGKSFTGFAENPIDFPPTFKYVHGSSTLDVRRAPAYTDRILHTLPPPSTVHSPPTEVFCQAYTSHPILWSDHRPVSATYTVHVRVADEDRRRQEYVGVERELEKLEEVYRPALEVDGTNVEFGEVKVGRRRVQEVRLRNKGKVPAMFDFKPSSTDKPICKAPIWPFPCRGVVEPGQETVLRLVLCVEEDWAKRLTLMEADLNDVLVLRVDGGKDTFLTVGATFAPTILSLPLSLLASLPGPIRWLSPAARKGLTKMTSDPYDDKANRPGPKPVRDIWRLLEYLMASGQGIDGLWTTRVDKDEILGILEDLDTGEEIQVDKEKVVAATLIYILRRLESGLVGGKEGMCEGARDRDEAFAALEGVSQAQTNVLIGSMSVMRLCMASASTSNPADSESLSRANEVEHEEAQHLEADVKGGPIRDTDGKRINVKGRKDAVDILNEVMVQSPASDDGDRDRVSTTGSPTPMFDEDAVNVLVEAVFGRVGGGDARRRKRFVRLMLEA